MPDRTGQALIALLVATLLGMLQACSREPAQQPAASAPAASASAPAPARQAGPHLLLALAQPDGVAWQRVDSGSGQSQSLGRSPPAVELWALDDTQGDFYFSADKAVWRGNWRGSGQAPQRLATLPEVQGVVHAAWLDAASRTLRVIEMREPTSAEARRMKAEPPDARPYWAILWAHSAQGWSIADKRATAWGADGSVGPAILDDRRQAQGRSARALDDAAGCASLCDQDAAAPEGVDPGAAEEWRSVDLQGTRLLFGVALGDSWQPVGPLLSQVGAGRPRLLLPGAAAALRLQVRQGRLLVSPQLPQPAERTATDTVIIDIANGERRALGPAATLPVWVE